MECSIFGCIAGVYANGLCHPHYDKERIRKAPECSESGCYGKVHSKGLCNSHYRAMLRKNAKSCKVEGCGKAVVCRGLCDTHRLREDHHGHLDPTRPQDWGSKAKHPLYNTWHWIRRFGGNVDYDPRWDDFWVFAKDVGDKKSARHRLKRKDIGKGFFLDNVEWQEQKITSDNRAAYAREWRLNNPDKVRNSDFKKNYGITLKQYEQMMADQDNLCAICEKPENAVNPTTQKVRNLAVAHCHKTGKVRGLLCTSCNSIIGHADDSVDLLEEAIHYITNC